MQVLDCGHSSDPLRIKGSRRIRSVESLFIGPATPMPRHGEGENA